MVALSDSSGSIVEAYSYDVFGAVKVHTAYGADTTWLTSDDDTNGDVSQYGNPYRFTGRRYDEETGLYYYRARMYAPAIGRFLQPDPIGYADSMNLYQYCLNNPVNFFDRFGLSSKEGLFIKKYKYEGGEDSVYWPLNPQRKGTDGRFDITDEDLGEEIGWFFKNRSRLGYSKEARCYDSFCLTKKVCLADIALTQPSWNQ